MHESLTLVLTDSSSSIVGETLTHLDDTNNVDHLSKRESSQRDEP